LDDFILVKRFLDFSGDILDKMKSITSPGLPGPKKPEYEVPKLIAGSLEERIKKKDPPRQ
jgi:hypothetical protein